MNYGKKTNRVDKTMPVDNEYYKTHCQLWALEQHPDWYLTRTQVTKANLLEEGWSQEKPERWREDRKLCPRTEAIGRKAPKARERLVL